MTLGLRLLSAKRHRLAEEQFGALVAQDPTDARARVLLSICLAAREDRDGAEREARAAIGANPAYAAAHDNLASVLLKRNDLVGAEAAAREALRLDADDADFHLGLAHVLAARTRWAEALGAVESALALDPGHVGANNLRAHVLLHLNRRGEAGRAIDSTLARDPENPATHAHKGWALLHAGDPKGAQAHFRESLRLNPTGEMARKGLVEALKARNPAYRLLLGFFLAMNRLPDGTRRGILFGGWLGYVVLGQVRTRNPDLAPFLAPVLAAYFVFCVFTWAGPIFFNLLLLLHPLGRHALDRSDKQAAGCGGILLVAAAGLYAGHLATGDVGLKLGALLALVHVLSVQAIFAYASVRYRLAMLGYAAACAAAGGAIYVATTTTAATVLGLAAVLGPLFSGSVGSMVARRMRDVD